MARTRVRSAAALIGAAVCGLATAAHPVRVGAGTEVRLSAELGPELDSNAERQASDVDAVTSPLMRMVADGSLRLRTGRHRIALSYGGGAKLFFRDQAREADELVHRAGASFDLRVAEGLSLALLGSYYDVYQRQSTQDFRTGSSSLRLSLAGRKQTVASLQLGYQGLQFKPFEDYDFHGLAGGLSLATRVVADRDDDVVWRLGASYSAALRWYQGPVLATQRRDPCAEDPLSPTCGQRRRDLGHALQVWADYSGNAVARLWYSIEVNGSNSFGETFTRHAVGIKYTTLLGGGLFLTTKGVLRFSRFRDPFLVVSPAQSRFVDIDDENRSTLLLSLARDVSARWSVMLRYELHVNESSGGDPQFKPPDFLRHLLFLGVRFRYGTAPDDA